MFEEEETYRRVKEAGVITREVVSRLYNVPPEEVQLFHCDNARAIKFSIPRRPFSGDPGDGDVYGGQQYGPLVDLEVP